MNKKYKDLYLDYEKMFVNYNKLLKKDSLAEYANHEFNHTYIL